MLEKRHEITLRELERMRNKKILKRDERERESVCVCVCVCVSSACQAYPISKLGNKTM